jgi:hypothetical protein
VKTKTKYKTTPKQDTRTTQNDNTEQNEKQGKNLGKKYFSLRPTQTPDFFRPTANNYDISI